MIPKKITFSIALITLVIHAGYSQSQSYIENKNKLLLEKSPLHFYTFQLSNYWEKVKKNFNNNLPMLQFIV